MLGVRKGKPSLFSACNCIYACVNDLNELILALQGATIYIVLYSNIYIVLLTSYSLTEALFIAITSSP